jgi:hypothetical protein
MEFRNTTREADRNIGNQGQINRRMSFTEQNARQRYAEQHL